MVLVSVWPLSTSTMGIKTTDFVLLVANSGNGMQMLSPEGGKTWLTATLEKRLKCNSYSIDCLPKARTRGQQKLTISWLRVFLNSSPRYQVEVTCTPPLCLEIGWVGFKLKQQPLMSLFGHSEAQGWSVSSMRHAISKDATSCYRGTTTKNQRMHQEDDHHFRAWNTSIERQVAWTPLHSTKRVWT